MKRINYWKAVALAAILPAIIALQPVVTQACSGVGSHGGC